ncbi:hypothetical protein [Sphingobacterium griseoflavum]|uniref:hypothetical protein n=1 Tax=Sphingobacterium griseoflavum TaxID=1474952 RepID=UPI001674B156|nr:hypothetical protein [Sphingobacterium griseoflavum]
MLSSCCPVCVHMQAPIFLGEEGMLIVQAAYIEGGDWADSRTIELYLALHFFALLSFVIGIRCLLTTCHRIHLNMFGCNGIAKSCILSSSSVSVISVGTKVENGERLA